MIRFDWVTEYRGKNEQTRYLYALIQGVRTMKLTKFDLTKNIGKPKAANLFRFGSAKRRVPCSSVSGSEASVEKTSAASALRHPCPTAIAPWTSGARTPFDREASHP